MERFLCILGGVLRVVKEVRIRFVDREATALALFDAGSSYTVVRRSFFEKVFGATWTSLPRPVKLCLADGRLVSLISTLL